MGGWLRTWDGALLAVAALATVAYWCPYVGHWDAYDYAACMLRGEPSSLMTGRPLFIGGGWLVAQLAAALGWPAEQLHVPLKLLVLGCALATPLVARRLFLRLSDPETAGWGALALAASPAAAHVGGMMMTEAPMMLAVLLGWLGWQRGIDGEGWASWALAGAGLGVAFGIREQALMALPWLAVSLWLAGRRPWGGAALAGLVFLLTAAAGPLVCAWRHPGYLDGMIAWRRSMQVQAGLHPIDASNLLIWAGWVLACQPLAPLAWLGWARLPRAARGLAVAQLLVLLALAAYQDLLYSPRFLLVATPGLALLVGAAIAARASRPGWPRAALLVSALALLGGWLALAPERDCHLASRELATELRDLPDGSLLLIGQATPLVSYLREAGAVGDLETIAPGWTWPGPALGETIDQALAAGRPVYIDEDPRLWLGHRIQLDLQHWTEIRARYRLRPVPGSSLKQLGP